MSFPNYNHLYYFHVVAQEGSLRRASNVLGVKQPTISTQIKALETFLEVRLFHRDRGGMRLTREGRRVHEQTSLMFRASATVLQALGRGDEGSPPTRRIGITERALEGLPHSLVNEWVASLPHPTWTLEVAHHKRLLEDLEDGNVDLLVTDEQLNPSSDWVLTTVLRPSFVCIGPLSWSGELRFPKSLHDAPFYRYTSDSKIRWATDKIFQRQKVSPKFFAETNRASLMVSAVEAGLCAAVVPHGSAAPALANGTVRMVARLHEYGQRIAAIRPVHAAQSVPGAIMKLRSKAGSLPGPRSTTEMQRAVSTPS